MRVLLLRGLLRPSMLMLVVVACSGCGLLFGTGPEPTPTAPAEVRQLVPTFTATAPGATVVAAEAPPTATQTPAVIAAAPVTTTAASTTTTSLTTTQSITVSSVDATPAATATPTNTALLTVEQEQINLRLGPGTDYGIAGDATRGAAFDIVGKNQQGDWWQVCCINGQPAWVFGALAKTENADNAPVITDLPARPVAQAPAPPPPPEQPTAAPPPAEEAPPPAEVAPPAGDPCAGIGGDGCKFRITGGPKFATNGGSELKLQLMFKHSGDSNRPQGDYFVAMFKDGEKLPIGDGTRSQVDVRQQGPQGEYNYEYKVGLGDLPGNTVAGNYTIYVLDGTGERDSQDFSLAVPDGQGEIWIEFDQG